MFCSARVPRGVQFQRCLALVAGAMVVASLQSCSDGVAAQSRSASELDLAGAAFEPEGVNTWESLVAHSQRITPTPDWDGTLNGPKTLWFEGGAKRGEGRFTRGEKEGPWTFWYENGQKRWEGTYHEDLVQGSERSWYANGQLCFEGSSVEGRRHGTFRAWYEDGQAWWEGSYELGVRQGLFRYWHRDGTADAKVSGLYEKGKRTADVDGQALALVEPR